MLHWHDSNLLYLNKFFKISKFIIMSLNHFFWIQAKHIPPSSPRPGVALLLVAVAGRRRSRVARNPESLPAAYSPRASASSSISGAPPSCRSADPQVRPPQKSPPRATPQLPLLRILPDPLSPADATSPRSQPPPPTSATAKALDRSEAEGLASPSPLRICTARIRIARS